MTICVECGHDVKALYREFSKGNIRLAHCEFCGELADKYVELDAHIVFIDLVLHRVQAYRHVLYNRQIVRVSREILKFLVVIFAFDSFDLWFRLQNRSQERLERPWEEFTRWLKPHPNQWVIPSVAIVETVVYLIAVSALTQIVVSYRLSESKKSVDLRFLVSAVIFSCFSKLGILLWMVWDAPLLHRQVISLFTLTSNVLAVRVFLRTPRWLEPTLIVLGGLLSRLIAGQMLNYHYNPIGMSHALIPDTFSY